MALELDSRPRAYAAEPAARPGLATPIRNAARAPRRSRSWLLLLLLLVMASAGAGGWYWWQRDAAAQNAWMTVPATRGTIEDSITAIGNLQPRDYVDVGTQVSGQLRAIYFDIGDEVEKGDLLAELDPTVYESRVEGDRAELRNLQAQLAQRQAERALAAQQLQRQQGLLQANATSQDAFQSAQATLKVSDAQIEALRAQIAQMNSTLRGDEANLGYTQIYAPMSGTVVSVSAKQGQTLNANQSAPTILRIADLNTMTVWTQVSEADVGRLEIGMNVYFTTLGNPDRRWTGTLKQILPTPETVNNVILYNALFDVANLDRALKTQMTAQVFFLRDRAEDALTVPLAALQAGAGRGARSAQSAEPRVRVLANGRVEERPVTVGVRNRVAAEIKSGLAEGEQVIVGTRTDEAPSNADAPLRRPRL